jgi:hypothetical protein
MFRDSPTIVDSREDPRGTRRVVAYIFEICIAPRARVCYSSVMALHRTQERIFTALPRRKPRLKPLSTEDGNNGYWDAKRMGNGRGRSFVVINGVRKFVTDEELEEYK